MVRFKDLLEGKRSGVSFYHRWVLSQKSEMVEKLLDKFLFRCQLFKVSLQNMDVLLKIDLMKKCLSEVKRQDIGCSFPNWSYLSISHDHRNM
jgi:hypothetical protein